MAGAAAARGTEVKAAPNVVVMQILCSVAAAAPPRCRCTTAQAQATMCALRTICLLLEVRVLHLWLNGNQMTLNEGQDLPDVRSYVYVKR